MFFYFLCSTALLVSLSAIARRHTAAKKYFIIVTAILCVLYFLWRAWALPRQGGWNIAAGLLLYGAELLGLSQFIMMQFFFTRHYCIKQKTAADFGGVIPSVDVFICTYNEPVSLLENTILCAMNLHYSRDKLHIWVCDDGRREALQNLCRELHVGYLTRPTNEGAKAGNLNHALSKTSGDLFAVLDADMLCTPAFLERTCGYFSDPAVAFVQTPQVYYNQDMYQRNLKRHIPNEQDFFMRDIQEGRAAAGAVLHVGTNALFRRSHVEACGGYPTNTITEDMALGMLLQARGLRTVFINEPLVLGLSAATYTDLTAQRDRWCRGNLQVFRRFRPLSLPLRPVQKWIYLDGTLYWFGCYQKMIYLLAPLLFLFSQLTLIRAPYNQLVFMFLPYFFAQILTFRLLAPDSRSLLWAHFYEVAMAPHTCFSIFKELFSIHTGFRVTPKEALDDHAFFQFGVILPHCVLAFLTFLAWIWGSVLFLNGHMASVSYAINMAWSVYNFIGIIICIRAAYHIRSPQRKAVPLRPAPAVSLRTAGPDRQARLTALSYETLSLEPADSRYPADGQEVCISISAFGLCAQIPATCRRCGSRLECSLKRPLSISARRLLIRLFMENLNPYYQPGRRQCYQDS